MATKAVATRDHDEIRRWVEEHGGIPTRVKGTGGLLRIDFVKGPKSGGREPSLEEISWDDWFRIFDQQNLVFMHGTGDSKFFKLVYPDTLQEKQRRKSPERGRAGAGRRASSSRSGSTARSAGGSGRRSSSASGRRSAGASSSGRRSASGSSRRSSGASSSSRRGASGRASSGSRTCSRATTAACTTTSTRSRSSTAARATACSSAARAR